MNFTRGEWKMLEPSQRELYKEMLLENLRNLEFVGKTSSLRNLTSKRVASSAPVTFPKDKCHVTVLTVSAGHPGPAMTIPKKGA